MVTRMTARTVVFSRPFVLPGFERVEPAGSYLVETEEEQLDTFTQSAWRRLATIMHITRGGATEYVKIDPMDLDKALARDEVQQETQASAQARLDADRRKAGARTARRKRF